MVSSFLFIFAGMEKIYNYYQDIVTAYTRRADNLKKKIHLLGSIRLLLVAGLIAMVWFFKSEDWKVLAGIAVLFTIPFIALMVWHTKLFARKCYAEALANLCKNELNGLDYDFSAFDGAPEKVPQNIRSALIWIYSETIRFSSPSTARLLSWEKRSWPAGLCNHSPTRL